MEPIRIVSPNVRQGHLRRAKVLRRNVDPMPRQLDVSRSKGQYLVVSLLLTTILVLNLSSSRHRTPTYDEMSHYIYGWNFLEFKSDRFDDSKMPFSALNAIPGKIAKLPGAEEVQLRMASLPTMLFSLLLAFYIFKWSRALYGILPGLFSLVLYVFEPNFLGHAQLVTTDVYAACMITLSTYTFWRFSLSRDWKHAALSATVLGLAQLAKYTSVFLYPLFLALLLIRDLPHWLRLVTTRDVKALWRYLRRGIQYGFLFVIVSLIIVNIGFLFNRSFTPLKDYKFRSHLFRTVQSRLSFFGDVPVPLPYPFVEGLDWVRHRERTGEAYGRTYLLGKLGGHEGFKSYFFYACLYKVPIAIQLTVLFATVAYLVRRKDYRFLENELFLLGPVVFFFMYFSFFFRAQIGIRFFLVLFPFIHIFCGSLLRGFEAFSPVKKTGVAVLVSYLMVSVLSYFPHFLSYFNELVWDRRQAYKVLADSNLDWGQSGWYLERYLAEHREAQFEPPFAVAGKVVVSVNGLTGIGDPKRFQWLRDHFEPSETIAYSYLVYEITPDNILDVLRDSPEFDSRASSLPPQGPVTAFVTNLYIRILGREPDPAGLQSFVTQLNRNRTVLPTVQAILASPEFLRRNTTDTEFVTILYRIFLDRLPDPEGLSGGVLALSQGAIRAQLVAQFAASPEFQAIEWATFPSGPPRRTPSR